MSFKKDMHAKDELLGVLQRNGRLDKVRCAQIRHYRNYQHETEIVLKCGYTADDWSQFLDKLDFYYHSGYGSQELFGTVWLSNESWLERAEYDGSEWWEYRSYPAIPEECAAVTPEAS